VIAKLLYSHLKDNCPSFEGRIYPLYLKEDSKPPCLVYKIVTNRDVETLGCSIGSVVRFQLDIFDESYAGCVSLKDEVKNALQSFVYRPFDVYVHEVYENELELYREIVDFQVKF